MLSTQMFGFAVKNDSFELDLKQRLMVTFSLQFTALPTELSKEVQHCTTTVYVVH